MKLKSRDKVVNAVTVIKHGRGRKRRKRGESSGEVDQRKDHTTAHA
jgi:hypothetical protein